MAIVKAVFEKNILLGRDLRINFIATDERRKILKIVDASVIGRSVGFRLHIFYFYKLFFGKLDF